MKKRTKAKNNKNVQGKFEKGSVGAMIIIHDDNCPQLKGGCCVCSPRMQVISAEDYLKLIKKP